MRHCLAVALSVAAFALLVPSSFGQLGPLSQALAARPIVAPAALKMTQKHGTVFFNTNIGSFKILGNEATPAEGTLDMIFTGTLLISDLDAASKVEITGSVRKEIDDKADNKVVYYGSGRLTMVGKYRAVQFFGRDLRARFDGFGVVRMTGEFDKNLDTGMWWYDDLPEKEYWNTSLNTANVPHMKQVKPKVEIEGGGKG